MRPASCMPGSPLNRFEPRTDAVSGQAVVPSDMSEKPVDDPDHDDGRTSGECREAPLIVHVIHALSMGGLENGLVNLINGMDREQFRHAIVCMSHSTDFARRIRRADVAVYEMHRDAHPIWRTYLSLLRLFRRIEPAIVHSRNLSGLDAIVPAMLAGVRVRIHGEHGRDVDNLDGSNPRQLRLKRLFRPFVSHYSAVSKDLAADLVNRVGAAPERVTQIYNGVDTVAFCPAPSGEADSAGSGRCVIGTVGRLQPVKDQALLVEAYAEAYRIDTHALAESSLLIVGDGPCRETLSAQVQALGMSDRIVLAGASSDVPEVLRSFDLFVLPSLAEGISNTILEAMATGLPVVATRVGGNADLVLEGQTGTIVPAADRAAMTAAILAYARDRSLRRRHGRAGRLRAEREFSMDAMMRAYTGMYTQQLA